MDVTAAEPTTKPKRRGEAEAAPDSCDVFASLGLEVAERHTATSDPVFIIRGDTHPHRQALREAGGRWDRIAQHWVFTGTDPRPKLAESLSSRAQRSGFSDSASPDSLADRPSYWGHRQRLRDRFLGGSDEALPDYELLELLLFYAIPRIDTKPLAKELLRRFGSLGSVLHASPEQLAEFDKINQQTLVLFKTVRAQAARLAREDLSDGQALTSWDKLVAYLRTSMAHRKIEQFRVLFLDRRNVLIADEVQNEGSIDHTPVYPREVVKRALTLDASAVIMVHNHPSNHPAPSRGDIEMTKTVRQALETVGVVLHDHVIVSRKGHTSFKQMQLL